MLFWAGWILFVLVTLWTVPAVWALLCKQLRPLPPTAVTEAAVRAEPQVSVIVPARNEGQQIEKALRSILNSEGVQIQLLTVNDRSTDATGEIMEALAAEDPRITVLHVQELPADWLGKNHAMHVAAQRATGDLLLFTDGDVVYEPLAIASAVAWLRQQRLQHLCLLPRMLPGNIWENATVVFFGLSFAVGMQLHLIRTRWPFSYAGVGAFNLIDAAFYRRIGGHVPIAMDVLDDVKLGKLVRRNGGQQDFLSAPQLLSIRWQPSLWGVVTGLEKNAFASLDYSVAKLAIVTVVFFATMVSPYVVLLSWPWIAGSGWTISGFAATLLVWHSCFAAAAVVSRGGWQLAPLFPIGAFVMAFAYWRSAWITLRRGGIRWRDSFYPLSRLRAALFH